MEHPDKSQLVDAIAHDVIFSHVLRPIFVDALRAPNTGPHPAFQVSLRGSPHA